MHTHFIIREKTDVMRWWFSTGWVVGSTAKRTQAGRQGNRSPCALFTTGICSDRWDKIAQLGDYFKGHHSWPRSA